MPVLALDEREARPYPHPAMLDVLAPTVPLSAAMTPRAVLRFGWALAATVALLTTSVAPSSAAPSKRYTTLIEDYVDGKKQATSAFELRLTAAMIKAGITFIDQSQSRKIRSVTDAGQLMAGKVSPVITSLDADYIVAGICRLSRLKSDLLGEDMYRYDASCQVKVVAVDTGQIVNAYQERGQAIGYTQVQGAEKSAQQAADMVAKKLLADRAKLGSRIELIVEGIPNFSAGDIVLKGVEALKTVKGVRMLSSTRAITKVEMTLKPGKTARMVAAALDGSRRLGLSVVGYSDRTIKATYAPESTLSVPLVLTALSAKRGKKRADAWHGKAIAGIVGTALSNLSFFKLPRGTRAVALGKPKKWSQRLVELGVDPATSLVLVGDHRRNGPNVAINLRLVVARTQDTLSATTATCPREGLSACVAKMADTMAGGLLAKILSKRHLFKGNTDVAMTQVAARAGRSQGRSAKPLEVVAFELGHVFPSRMAAYAKRPVGKLVVKNVGKKTLTKVAITTHLPGFMSSPLDATLPDIKPGKTVEVPLKVVLSRDKLVTHDENQPAVLELTLGYNEGEFRIEDRRSRATVVFDRNTVTWQDTASVAAFVAPRTANIQRVAKTFAAAVSNTSPKFGALKTATAIFAGLGMHGMRYQQDPVHPFRAEALDYVQYPQQTLLRRAGDCDDLAVLYASIAEALGQPVLVITTPGHVFVAVYTGIPIQSATRLSLDSNDVVAFKGLAWVPLETTLLGQSVEAAWKAAVKELSKWKKDASKVEIIGLRDAWKDFPPTSLAGNIDAGVTVDASLLSTSVGQQLDQLSASRRAQVTKALARVRKTLKTSKGDAGLHLREGLLLALSGKPKEALASLDKAKDDATWGASALNNSGNVWMSLGKATKAWELYRASLARKKDARVTINAAIAAHALNDEDGFAEHIFEALELGAEELVAVLSKSGIGGQAGARGSDGRATAGRDLSEAIRAAYKKRGRKLPASLSDSGAKATDASGSGVMAIESYLFWL